jgi:hypothetical protein
MWNFVRTVWQIIFDIGGHIAHALMFVLLFWFFKNILFEGIPRTVKSLTKGIEVLTGKENEVPK